METGLECGEEQSPHVQAGHKQHSAGAHRPAAGRDSGFILWQWVQVLMGTGRSGHHMAIVDQEKALGKHV